MRRGGERQVALAAQQAGCGVEANPTRAGQIYFRPCVQRGVVTLDNSRLYISNFGSNNIAVYDIDLALSRQ